MRILKDGECPDALWGLEKELITNEMIEALHDGCYFNVAHKDDTICEVCSRYYFDKYYATGGDPNVPD